MDAPCTTTSARYPSQSPGVSPPLAAMVATEPRLPPTKPEEQAAFQAGGRRRSLLPRRRQPQCDFDGFTESRCDGAETDATEASRSDSPACTRLKSPSAFGSCNRLGSTQAVYAATSHSVTAQPARPSAAASNEGSRSHPRSGHRVGGNTARRRSGGRAGAGESERARPRAACSCPLTTTTRHRGCSGKRTAVLAPTPR